MSKKTNEMVASYVSKGWTQKTTLDGSILLVKPVPSYQEASRRLREYALKAASSRPGLAASQCSNCGRVVKHRRKN